MRTATCGASRRRASLRLAAAVTASRCAAVTLAPSDSSSATNSSSADSLPRASSRYASTSSAEPPYLRMSALSLS